MKILKKVASVFREATKARSSGWRKVRKEFIAKNPACAACGGKMLLQVHHVIPFHIDPALELDASNLITLCMWKNNCHSNIGHGDDWKCYNPNVREDCERALAHPELWKEIDDLAHKNRVNAETGNIQNQ